ncbi:hypothetical protein [Compostimonas suwonensis]|uniref:Uncharacterized protein n=1 Tax=Compostimonas suwonensis TaxID=1048394 RepID=A0A2M9BUU1_9MICO|nr:hypothetical protein [Compostimonas suwonensis]PJJ61718.1 hypothetical protein CLV54_2668 [Compostimonas suwonensis]
MTIALIIFAALAVWAVVATTVQLIRDGYRPRETRTAPTFATTPVPTGSVE